MTGGPRRAYPWDQAGPPALLLTLAVGLGGGGSPAPGPELIVEWAALLMFAIAVAQGLRPGAAWAADRTWTVAIGAICLFPLLQLLPLPPTVWQALPGRAPAVAALQAAGVADGWRPWSLLPDGGVAAALALVPAVVLALMTARLSLPGRIRVVIALALLGGVAALLGVVQFILGPDRPLSLYGYVHQGFGIGFFANRNAQADLMAVALIAAILLADRFRHRLTTPPARVGAALALLLLLVGGVVTGSRMGAVVLVIPVPLGVVLAGRRARRWGVIAALCGVALLVGGTALDRVTGRVHDDGNRLDLWTDSVVAARGVAPAGAGMGSFVPLFEAAERLDVVGPTYANRAHNDYLELAIEGGAPALMLLAALGVFAGRRSRRNWGSADPDARLMARFGGLTLLVFAVHSTVDYPLRTLTLLGIAGVATGALAFPPPASHRRRGAFTRGDRGALA